jgi:hypothetical protein
MNYKKIADVILSVLMIKTMELMLLKKAEELTEEDAKISIKGKCEMVQNALKDFYDITDYTKFAQMMKKCDITQLIISMIGNSEVLEKAIYKIIEEQADDCLVQVEG